MQEYGLRPVELDILFFLDMQKDVDTARELIRTGICPSIRISIGG